MPYFERLKNTLKIPIRIICIMESLQKRGENFKMKITKIASSTIIINLDDLKIVCDPWIENGEYYGSWFFEEKGKFSCILDSLTFSFTSRSPDVA